MSTIQVDEFCVIHSDLEILHATKQIRDLFSVGTSDKIIGKSFDQFIIPADRSVLYDHLDGLRKTDSALAVTVGIQNPCEAQQAVLLSSMIEFNGESCIQTVLFPLEAKSIDEFGSYAEAMDQAPIGITIADLTFHDEPIVYVNDGFVELTGYQREEVLGRNCRFLQGDKTCEESVNRIREAIENTEQVTVELRNYRKDGSLFWNELTLIPIRDGDGSVTKYIGYQQDITARRI